MEFRILGPLEVAADGRAIDLGGAKQRAVLGVLLVNARRVVTADKLADAVWDGVPPPAVSTTLRSYVSNLRKAFGDADTLRTRDRGYVLDAPDGSIDAEAFEDLAGRGRKALVDGDAALAAKLLDEALGLWRGEALEDFVYSPFAQAEAARLEDLRVGALEDLMEARLAVGEHVELTSQLDVLTTRHPLRERLWRSRMLALARSGRTGEALEAYEQARRHLADELGIDPSPELRRVHESILKQCDEVEMPRPPLSSSGAHIASFVFTDVERSTRMLQALGEHERYAEVIEEQRRLLRDVFDARGCRFVQSIGEEFFAAFDSSTAAVRAALDAQLALVSHDWGDAGEIRVRMGVHTGETTVLGGEYVGLSVHLASRICDAAHGGQVLVSQASAELIDPTAIAPAGLVDAGPHVLKDFDNPVRLHQLVHPELRRDFPPPRTLSAMPHNLPARLTSLVGRAEEITEVAALLERSRLVTLTGVGGVGKTRLSLEVAAETLPSYPDGVWFCELAPVGDSDGIVQAVSKAIRLERPSQPGAPQRELLLDALSQRRTLLLLDNCEHVLEPVADLIGEVLQRCPWTYVLATSREGIAVRGEQIQPLRSLRVPDVDEALSGKDAATAVRLFVDRARAVRPEFTIGPQNAAAVVEICRRLDGIPLAIELAAARISSIGPLEIAARLDKAFRFLRSGERTAVERHRTLRAAIDWSYELLDAEEQRLFERLSVFSGGFSLDAVEDVCSADLDVDASETLDGLVSKHLVDVDVSHVVTRYTMLETIRQYASDKLAARGEEQQLREAHGEYFARFSVSMDPVSLANDPGASALMAEVANSRAAFEWAFASNNVDRALRLLAGVGWHVYGNLPSESRDLAFRAIGMPHVEDHDLAPVIFGLAAYVAWGQSEFPHAIELARQAFALAPDVRDARRLPALSALSAVQMFTGQIDEAAETIGQIEALDGADPVALALWNVNRALVAGYAGDRERAYALLDEAKPYVVRYPYLQNQAYYVLAEISDEDLDPDATIAAAERAHAHAVSTGNTFIANASLLRAASVRSRRGDPLQALREYATVIDAWRLGGNHTQQWLTLLNLAEGFARVGCDEAALVLIAAHEADPDATPVYGEHEQRLEKLVSDVESRLGATASAAARERGRGLGLAEAVMFALDEIRRVSTVDGG